MLWPKCPSVSWTSGEPSGSAADSADEHAGSHCSYQSECGVPKRAGAEKNQRVGDNHVRASEGDTEAVLGNMALRGRRGQGLSGRAPVKDGADSHGVGEGCW